MIEYIANKKNKNIILFVHGFTGDKDTWGNPGMDSFPLLLMKNEKIAESFDIALFSYYTKLLNLFSKGNKVSQIVKKLFKKSHQKLRNNNSIEEIANLLRVEIRFKLQEYDNIIIVAHSMGGLVAKSCIIKDIQENIPTKIRLFISLAVPHMGVELASYGKLISNNIQIDNLAPLNSFIHDINDVWLKTSIRPKTKYFYGVHDGVVVKTSAAPIDKEKSDIISVDENHVSICKPDSQENTTLVAVKTLIIEYLNNDPGVYQFEIQTLPDHHSYDDELFVLKLIVADIHNSSVRNAKEVFLNAEYARKIFNSESDQKRLSELYGKIRTIYNNNYSKYVHDGIKNSGMLLAEINSQILNEDKNFLDTLIPFINAIHKQGMLQQLANSEDGEIWWTKDTGLDYLNRKMKEKNNE